MFQTFNKCDVELWGPYNDCISATTRSNKIFFTQHAVALTLLHATRPRFGTISMCKRDGVLCDKAIASYANSCLREGELNELEQRPIVQSLVSA